MSMRERWGNVGVYFGLVDEPGAPPAEPATLVRRLVYAAVAGVVWALLTWAWQGGSTASIVLPAVVFAVLMFIGSAWGPRRADDANGGERNHRESNG
ncbi:MAG: hypothetical protein J7513_16655 [Solirubrobacteraceae bacterium]|nr:hypothetical protein [Solirubrobacteraceae bacterium]